jgi:uncharacterized membrane protein YkoI
MRQRVTFVLAAAVTGFLLVALGGVVGRVVNASASQAAVAPTAELVSAMQGREAVYRQLIAEANARIEQAQATGGEPSQLSTPITAAKALLIATSAAGGRLVRLPELVNVQGTVAWEVVLSSGTFYVNATTGQILASPKPQTVTVVRSSGDDHEEHEHEGEGGGDD